MPKRKVPYNQISITLPQSVWEGLRMLAEISHRSYSAEVTIAVEEHLKRAGFLPMNNVIPGDRPVVPQGDER